MKAIVTIVCVSFCCAVISSSTVLGQTALAPSKSESTKDVFDAKRDAAKDILVAQTVATKEHKRVLLDVGGDWCPWCKKLDKLFRSDKEISKTLSEKFVVVKVNYSPENQNKAVLGRYPQVEGYPHLFVLDVKGKLVHSQPTSELEEGDHHDPAKVRAFLKKWAP